MAKQKKTPKSQQNGNGEFDPSFDENPNDGPSSAAPAAGRARGVRGRVEQPAQPAAAPAQPAAPGELAIWRYQPKDEQGRPVGGEQIFKYDPSLPIDDPKSLASQLTKSNMHATVALKAKRTQAVIDEVKKVDSGYKPPVFLTADLSAERDPLKMMRLATELDSAPERDSANRAQSHRAT
jgi:hypothetical protein